MYVALLENECVGIKTWSLYRREDRSEPVMPPNAGWCPGWGGVTSKPTMKPLPRTRFFGRKLQDYIKENER